MKKILFILAMLFLFIPQVKQIFAQTYHKAINNAKDARIAKLYPDSAITYKVNVVNEDSGVYAVKYYNCSDTTNKYTEMFIYPGNYQMTDFDPDNTTYEKNWYRTYEGKNSKFYMRQIRTTGKNGLDFAVDECNPDASPMICYNVEGSYGRFFYNLTFERQPVQKYDQRSCLGLSYQLLYSWNDGWVKSSESSFDTLNDATNGTLSVGNDRVITFDTANNTISCIFYNNQSINNRKEEEVRTPSGFPLKKSEYEWDTVSNTFKLIAKTEFTYNAAMQLLNRTSSVFNFRLGKWISARGFNAQYDEAGKILSRSEFNDFNIYGNPVSSSQGELVSTRELEYLKQLSYGAPEDTSLCLYNTYYYYSATPKDNITVRLQEYHNIANDIRQVQSTCNIFPNPVHNELTIQAEFSGTGRLYNMQGQLMLSFALHSGSNTVSLGNLQKGLYLLKIPTEQGNITSKIIKK